MRAIATAPRGAGETLGGPLTFYNADMLRTLLWFAVGSSLMAPALAQTPQPFPRAGSQAPAQPAPSAPAPRVPPPPAAQTPPAQPAPTPPPTTRDPATPTEATLGFPIYPSARFIASYDAGRAQRYYIFGSTASFADLVAYYRTQLKEKGDLVYETPPTHMFEIGRFNSDTMAFPPGVTIKDWTGGGSKGYPNPTPGGEPARFPSIIMIVPAPAAAP